MSIRLPRSPSQKCQTSPCGLRRKPSTMPYSRCRCHGTRRRTPATAHPYTLSLRVGMARLDQAKPQTLGDLLNSADEALCAEKARRQGRAVAAG